MVVDGEGRKQPFILTVREEQCDQERWWRNLSLAWATAGTSKTFPRCACGVRWTFAGVLGHRGRRPRRR